MSTPDDPEGLRAYLHVVPGRYREAACSALSFYTPDALVELSDDDMKEVARRETTPALQALGLQAHHIEMWLKAARNKRRGEHWAGPDTSQKDIRAFLPDAVTSMETLADTRALEDYLLKNDKPIPVGAGYYAMQLASGDTAVKELVVSHSVAACIITGLLDGSHWDDMSSEAITTAALLTYMREIFSLLQKHTSVRLDAQIVANQSDKHTTATALIRRCRPDTMVVAGGCLLLIGEDKQEGQGELSKAQADLVKKLVGLNLSHYGEVQWLLGYIAAGAEVQFLRIRPPSKPENLGGKLNMHRPGDRKLLVTMLARLYCVMHLMVQRLPPQHNRPVLFSKVEKVHEGYTSSVTFFPGFVRKKITNFEAYALEAGISLEILEEIYRLAAEAADRQVLVSACTGPLVDRRGSYQVELRPVGYRPEPLAETEEHLRGIARASIQTCALLHGRGYVHRDIYETNVVCLAPAKYLIIDLEFGGRSGDGVTRSSRWEGSDVDSLGRFHSWGDLRMLRRMLVRIAAPMLPLSALAEDFVRRLDEANASADALVNHPWVC